MISASSVCGSVSRCAAPAVEGGRGDRAARARGFGFSSSVSTSVARGLQQRHARRARVIVQRAARVASPRPRFGTLTMRSKARSSAGLVDAAQIGERVADFGALVEARAADHAVGQAERDEAVLELAHLERGAHQDRDLVRANGRSRCSCSISSPIGAGFLLGIPGAGDGRPSRPARPRCAASCRAGPRCGRSGARRRRGCGRSSGSCARAGSPSRRENRSRSAGCCRPRRRASHRSTGRRRRRSRCSRRALARAAAARDTARRWCPGTRRPACS